MKSTLFFYCFVIFVSSCNSGQRAGKGTIPSSSLQAPDLFSDTSSYPRIYEYDNGTIEINGTPTDSQRVECKIREVSELGTIALYSSQSPTEYPPNSGLISDLFKKYRVNIRTYTDKTFSKPYN
jgi:hypothetical protein